MNNLLLPLFTVHKHVCTGTCTAILKIVFLQCTVFHSERGTGIGVYMYMYIITQCNL